MVTTPPGRAATGCSALLAVLLSGCVAGDPGRRLIAWRSPSPDAVTLILPTCEDESRPAVISVREESDDIRYQGDVISRLDSDDFTTAQTADGALWEVFVGDQIPDERTVVVEVEDEDVFDTWLGTVTIDAGPGLRFMGGERDPAVIEYDERRLSSLSC